MKTTEDITMDNLSEIRNPTYTINQELNKYDNVVLFPEKLAKANERLKILGHPEDFMKKEQNKLAELEKQTIKEGS